jgi:phosphomannomutase
LFKTLILAPFVADRDRKDDRKPLRKYTFSGEINLKVAVPEAILTELKEKYASGNQFELGGLSVEYFNVRSSNTEPLLRLIVETDEQSQMETKRDEILAVIRG